MQAKSDLTLLKNATLYTPKYLGQRSILIGGGQILTILTDALTLPAALNAQVHDLKGQRVIPGYIDSHTHITGGGGESGFAGQVPPPGLSQFTTNGVTTVVGLLGTDDLTRTTGNLLARVYGLREEGLSAYCWTGGYHFPLTSLTGSSKQDMVYLEPVIGIGEVAISDHRSSQPCYDDILRLASEAHVAGLMTGKAGVLQFHLGDGARKLEFIKRALAESELPARVFNPAHVNRNRPLFEQACQLCRQGITIDITAFPVGNAAPGLMADEAILTILNANQSSALPPIPLQQVILSSDAGGCMPCYNAAGQLEKMDFGRANTLHDTLCALLTAGIALETILPLLTQNVADFLRLPGKGQLAVGYDADLLVLDDNNTLTDVMAKGRWHLRDGVTLIKGTFE